MADDPLDPLEVGIGGGFRSASTYLELKTFSPLFSIAPMLKSSTATILYSSRSYSRPKVSSSQRMAFFSAAMAWSHLSRLRCFDKNLQPDVYARSGGEAVLDGDQRPGDHGEQVARLREGVDEGGKVAAIVTGPRESVRLPLASSTGTACPVADQGHGEARHDIGPIRVKGDLAKTLGLALGAEDAAGPVQPFESRIALRVDLHQRFQGNAVRHAGDCQTLAVKDVVVVRKLPAIELDVTQLQLPAVQRQLAGTVDSLPGCTASAAGPAPGFASGQARRGGQRHRPGKSAAGSLSDESSAMPAS